MMYKADKIYHLLLDFMFDRTWQDIHEEFSNYVARMRLMADDKFESLDPAHKIEVIFNLNEDQMTGRAKNFFRQLSQEHFSKKDLLEAIEMLQHMGNEHEEVVIYSPVLMSSEGMNNISRSFKNKFGYEARVVFKVDKELILGCRIEFANQKNDCSLARQSLSIINSKLREM